MTAEPDLQLELDDEPQLQILPPGTLVAERYCIVDIIGRGGMGVVYKAEQIHIERFVAMKMMLEQTSAASQDYRRFQREAKAASLLNHPNIVHIHDFGYADGQGYLCMDYLEGQSLDQILQKGPLTLDQFRHIFRQACSALQHAHDKGMVHRDLKPSNLMITELDGDKFHVVVLDFGLVKMADGKSDHKLTATNMVLGSPLYMSPEQCRATNLDHRSDIYSLACVMYEALAGVPPLTAETIFDVMNKHISTPPIPIRESAPGVYVPPALEKAIFQALAKSPDDRFQSMSELAKAIEASFSGAPDVVLPSLSQTSKATAVDGKIQGRRRSRRKRDLIFNSLGVLIAVFLLVAIGVMVERLIRDADVSRNRDLARSSTSNTNGVTDANASGITTGNTSGSTNGNTPGSTTGGAATNASKDNSNTQQSPLALRGTSIQGSNIGQKQNLPLDLSSLPLISEKRSIADSTAGSRTAQLPPPAEAAQNAAGHQGSHTPREEASTIVSKSTSQVPNSGDSFQSREATLDQILRDANADFSAGSFADARRKFEEVYSKTSSSSLKAQVLARLIYASYQLNDTRATTDYLNQFKDQLAYNLRAFENEGQLLASIFFINQRLGGQDASFEEQLAKAAIDILPDHGPPLSQRIHLRLELNHILIDQGKASDTQSNLEKALDEAKEVGDQTLISRITAMLAPPASAGFPGGGNGAGPPIGGFPGPPGGFPGNGPPPGPPGGGFQNNGPYGRGTR